jgi:hypothetical protein
MKIEMDENYKRIPAKTLPLCPGNRTSALSDFAPDSTTREWSGDKRSINMSRESDA